MKYVLTMLTLLGSLSLQAQRIYVVDRKDRADKLIYRSKYFSESDLVVCRTEDIHDTAKKHHWFFVDSRLKADWTICYTDNPDEADHIVFFTNRKGLLGSYSAHSKVDPIIPPTRAYTLNLQK